MVVEKTIIIFTQAWIFQRFPGDIDCTHMKSLWVELFVYVNRKGYSVNVLLISDVLQCCHHVARWSTGLLHFAEQIGTLMSALEIVLLYFLFMF